MRLSLGAQVNEALNDDPQENLDFSLRSETDQILTVGKRIALCMCRCAAIARGTCISTPVRHIIQLICEDGGEALLDT